MYFSISVNIHYLITILRNNQNNKEYSFIELDYMVVVIFILSFLTVIFVTTLFSFHISYIIKGLSTYLAYKYEEIILYHGNIFSKVTSCKNFFYRVIKKYPERALTSSRVIYHNNSNYLISDKSNDEINKDRLRNNMIVIYNNDKSPDLMSNKKKSKEKMKNIFSESTQKEDTDIQMLKIMQSK